MAPVLSAGELSMLHMHHHVLNWARFAMHRVRELVCHCYGSCLPVVVVGWCSVGYTKIP
jgi:hypothetical protein